MLLAPNGYLSHLTAMKVHNLIQKDLGKTVYTNAEQKPKPAPHAKLEQSRIDAAFKRPPRVTNNRVRIDDYTFCLLSGKHTNMLSVMTVTLPGIAMPIRVTSLERTLVDIVVRPAYSGGVHAILEAYRRAAEKANVDLMAEILDRLEYTYPYHQAIGFFMEQSHGYAENQINVFHRYKKNYDFYVDYEMVEPRYSPEWRVYYPSYLHINPNEDNATLE